MSYQSSDLSTWARPPSSVSYKEPITPSLPDRSISDTEPITDFARMPSTPSLPDRSDTSSYASRIRGRSPGGPPIPYNPEREQRTREKYRKRAIENEELKDAAEILSGLRKQPNKRRKIGGGFRGKIIYGQQQQPAAVTGQVFTPADFHKLTGIGRKILRRAAKRSSKAAVLKQLSDFGRKNKKHAKKCLFYAKCLTCDNNFN